MCLRENKGKVPVWVHVDPAYIPTLLRTPAHTCTYSKEAPKNMHMCTRTHCHYNAGITETSENKHGKIYFAKYSLFLPEKSAFLPYQACLCKSDSVSRSYLAQSLLTHTHTHANTNTHPRWANDLTSIGVGTQSHHMQATDVFATLYLRGQFVDSPSTLLWLCGDIWRSSHTLAHKWP